MLVAEDAVDLLDRDQEQLPPERPRADLEQIGTVDTGAEAKPLDDADPSRRRVDLEALAAAEPEVAVERLLGRMRIDRPPIARRGDPARRRALAGVQPLRELRHPQRLCTELAFESHELVLLLGELGRQRQQRLVAGQIGKGL